MRQLPATRDQRAAPQMASPAQQYPPRAPQHLPWQRRAVLHRQVYQQAPKPGSAEVWLAVYVSSQLYRSAGILCIAVRRRRPLQSRHHQYSSCIPAVHTRICKRRRPILTAHRFLARTGHHMRKEEILTTTTSMISLHQGVMSRETSRIGNLHSSVLCPCPVLRLSWLVRRLSQCTRLVMMWILGLEFRVAWGMVIGSKSSVCQLSMCK